MKTKKKGRSNYKLSAQEKKDIAILHKAAGRIASEINMYACCAIADSTKTIEQEERMKRIFYRAIDPDVLHYGVVWWGWHDCDAQEARIFALLLTAELIRTNSLP